MGAVSDSLRGGHHLFLDSYAPGSVLGLLAVDGEGDLVLYSHDHADHGDRTAVKVFSVIRILKS